MPTSSFHQLNAIVEIIMATNPRSLLDIGIGFGKYGYLAREYLELYDGRDAYSDWQRRIDGIEAFPDYLTTAHRHIYDEIYVGNALDILPRLRTRYDLILVIDVLEHFDYREGNRLLDHCLQTARNVLVSTLKRVGYQGAAFGNDFETHKFEWQRRHYDRFRKRRFYYPNHYSLICFIGDDIVEVKRRLQRWRWRVRARTWLPFRLGWGRQTPLSGDTGQPLGQ